MKLIQGDCIEEMRKLAEEGVKVDMILTDPPYGTTQCRWDSVIPFDMMWSCIHNLISERTPIVLFGREPFSSNLRMSNIKEYKYDWYWNKTRPDGHLNAKKQPMKQIENIHLFYQKQCLYNPQGLIKGIFNNDRPNKKLNKRKNQIYGKERNIGVSYYSNYPRNILYYANPNNKTVHPTQKPVDLLEYLIKTYTNEGDIVLDFTMGSGSTGVACKNLNRDFIGIELDSEYYDIAVKRINDPQTKLI